MFQIRVHGRGGQGVVTAAELLSLAAFADGWYAQAFPSFGSERTGAPVVAFCRIDDVPIRTREPIAAPDAVIIQDAGLLHLPEVQAGLADARYVLINSAKGVDDVELGLRSIEGLQTVATVSASEIARVHLGRPVPNAALLGGFAKLTGRVSFDSVAAAIRSRFGGFVGEQNVAAAQAAYDSVMVGGTHA